MAKTVSNFFWERLREWRVNIIFGYPGDGINGLLSALQEVKDDFTFVQARHEEMAAFMASAYAKFTGRLGVCMATSGPGASHLITGLYDARLDHMPVLAITGQQARTAIGGHYQQEIDLQSMFKDVAGAFVQQASAPAQVTDPEVPPLPPHITLEQARNFAAMLIEGDPRERHLIADTARQVLSAVLPKGKK